MRKMNTLDQAINNHFDWHPSRKKFFKETIISAIRTGHIHYKKLVEHVSGDAKECSKNRQMQRFMQKQDIDYTQAGKILIELLDLKDNFILAMDRTNWKFGKKEIKYLVISVIYETSTRDKRGYGDSRFVGFKRISNKASEQMNKSILW